MKAVKIPTIYNVADLLTKCHSTGTQCRLMGLVTMGADRIASGVSRGYLDDCAILG